MADADLEAGIDQAKKKPRNFALILKGQTVVKMIVQKKPIREGDIMFARRENKGNDCIVGVCFRNGAELTLQVAGEEPTLNPIKVKEFINEQTGITVKPLWEVVAELAFVDEEDETATPTAPAQKTQSPTPTPTNQTSTTGTTATPTNPQDTQQDGIPPAPPPPPPAPQQDKSQIAKVTAALKKASGDIQRVITAAPQARDEILANVARVKGYLKSGDDAGEQAMASFRELVALLASTLKNAVSQPTSAKPEAKKSDRIVTLQRSRIDWDSARKRLHSQLQSVEEAVYRECENPEEYDQDEVKEKVRVLDRLMEILDERLIDTLDQALNAADGAVRRSGFEKQAVTIINEYLAVVNSDPLVTAIDESGLVNISIKQSMATVLTELAGRLAS